MATLGASLSTMWLSRAQRASNDAPNIAGVPTHTTYPESTGASHFSWSGGSAAAGPPIKESGPAFDGEQGVGACFRPAAARMLEPAPDDPLAGAFHDAGSDRPAAFPVGVSQRIRSLLASRQQTQAATASLRSRCGFRPAMTGSTRLSFNCTLILSIRAFRPFLSGVRVRSRCRRSPARCPGPSGAPRSLDPGFRSCSGR